jgi:hypothetical protein
VVEAADRHHALQLLWDHPPGKEPKATVTSQWRSHLDGLSSVRFFALLVAPVLGVYLLTTSWTTATSPDTYTNAVAAWKLGTSGSIELEEWEPISNPPFVGAVSWIVNVQGRAVSKYPPGTTLMVAPLYAMFPGELTTIPAFDERRWESVPVDVPAPPFWPGALVAAMATALAVAIAGFTVRPLVGSTEALIGAYIYAFGTGAWGVASHDLWPHGPGMLWIALAVWLLVIGRRWVAGLAFGMAILTRPLTMIIAATAGLFIAVRRRSWRPIVEIGAGSVGGTLTLVWYNIVAFGSVSISGGYTSVFTDNVQVLDLGWYAENVVKGFYDVEQGLFIWSPFLLVVIVAAVIVRHRSTPEVSGPALGGLVYVFVHWKLNRFGGGTGFIGYRYPLEAIAAAAPMLFLGYRHWVSARPLATKLFLGSALFSIIVYAASV